MLNLIQEIAKKQKYLTVSQQKYVLETIKLIIEQDILCSDNAQEIIKMSESLETDN